MYYVKNKIKWPDIHWIGILLSDHVRHLKQNSFANTCGPILSLTDFICFSKGVETLHLYRMLHIWVRFHWLWIISQFRKLINKSNTIENNIIMTNRILLMRCNICHLNIYRLGVTPYTRKKYRIKIRMMKRKFQVRPKLNELKNQHEKELLPVNWTNVNKSVAWALVRKN